MKRQTQFSFWSIVGSPLIIRIGSDRKLGRRGLCDPDELAESHRREPVGNTRQARIDGVESAGLVFEAGGTEASS